MQEEEGEDSAEVNSTAPTSTNRLPGNLNFSVFSGDRARYRHWKAKCQLIARALTRRMDEGAVAMSILMALSEEAETELDVETLAIEEIDCEGGLTRLWEILDATDGELESKLLDDAG